MRFERCKGKALKTNEVKHNGVSVLDVPPHEDEEGHSVDGSSSGSDSLVGDVTKDVPIKEGRRKVRSGRCLSRRDESKKKLTSSVFHPRSEERQTERER